MSKVNQQARMFARITKIDEPNRLVYGRLAAEEVDKSNEIFDYATSKPYFERWSGEIKKDTNGKSVGNMRAMHGKVAAGVFKEIHFNDAEKAIDVVGKVVDDQEWAKCLEGVYTGFSIGGKYVTRKAEKVADKDVTRYTADPIEGSLVDRPMIPSCKFFDVQRADGTVTKVEFQDAEAMDLRRFDLIVEGQAEALLKGTVLDAVPEVGAAFEHGSKAYVVKAIDSEKKLVTLTESADAPTYEIEGSDEDVQRLLDVMKKGNLAIGDVIAAAEHLVGMKVLIVPTIKAELIGEKLNARMLELAKADKVDITDVTKLDPKYLAAAKLEQYSQLRKNLCSAGQFAYAIDAICRLHECAEYEAFVEGDASPIPAQLKACVAMCLDVLRAMIDEEKREIATDTSSYSVAMSEMVNRVGALKKRYVGKYDALLTVIDEVVKAFPPKKDEGGESGGQSAGGGGGQANADDVAFATKLHAVALKLGATCDKAGGAANASGDGAQPDKAASGDLTKLFESDAGKALLDAAIEKAVAPLKTEIEVLKKSPAPSAVRLRAVAKADDVGDQTRTDDKPVEAVKNADGSINESATEIKKLHSKGGAPLLGIGRNS